MRPSIWLAFGLTFVAPVYAQAPQLALKIVPTSVRDAGAQSPEAKRHSVWVGSIESAQSRYTMYPSYVYS